MDILKDNEGSPLDENLVGSLTANLSKLLENNSNTDHASQKAWLLETLGSIPVKERDRLRFLDHARRIPAVLAQTLMQLALSQPTSLGHLLRHEGSLLRRFFMENPGKIPAWFQFRFSEENQHGAQALERYLFDHRETAWDSLVWRTRGHPPVVVVHRKNLLMEIDVENTMRHFLYQEEFWCSSHMREVMKQGSFLQLDYQFFLGFLEGVLGSSSSSSSSHALASASASASASGEDKGKGQAEGRSALAKRLNRLLEDYFVKEPLKSLCQHLLPLFPDPELLSLMHRFSSQPPPLLKQRLLTESVWASLGEASLLHTLLDRGLVVLRLVKEPQNLASLGLPPRINFAQTLAHFRTLRRSTLLLRFPLLVFVLAFQLDSLHADEEAWADLASKNQLLPLVPDRFAGASERKSHKKHKSKRKKVERIVGWRLDGVLLGTTELPYAVANFLLTDLATTV